MSNYWTAGPSRSEPPHVEHYEECPQHPDSDVTHAYDCACREIADNHRDLADDAEFERWRDER